MCRFLHSQNKQSNKFYFGIYLERPDSPDVWVQSEESDGEKIARSTDEVQQFNEDLREHYRGKLDELYSDVMALLPEPESFNTDEILVSGKEYQGKGLLAALEKNSSELALMFNAGGEEYRDVTYLHVEREFQKIGKDVNVLYLNSKVQLVNGMVHVTEPSGEQFSVSLLPWDMAATPAPQLDSPEAGETEDDLDWLFEDDELDGSDVAPEGTQGEEPDDEDLGGDAPTGDDTLESTVGEDDEAPAVLSVDEQEPELPSLESQIEKKKSMIQQLEEMQAEKREEVTTLMTQRPGPRRKRKLARLNPEIQRIGWAIDTQKDELAELERQQAEQQSE